MAIDYRDWLIARERLAEHRWLGWDADEVANETGKRQTRYVNGILESEIDSFLDFLNRWISASNQSTFELTAQGADATWINGTYVDSGEVSYGHAVFRHESGGYELRVTVSQDTGAYYWQLIRVEDGAVLWISSGGSVSVVDAMPELSVNQLWLATAEGVLVPRKLGNELLHLSSVVWTPNEIVHEVTPELEVGVDWFVDVQSGAVIEPVTGELSLSLELPVNGIQYRSVTNPQINNGKERAGVWRQTNLKKVYDYDGRYKDKGSWIIIQTLDLELNASASFDDGETRWRRKDADYFKSGSRNAMLELPFVDPAVVDDLADALNASSDLFDSRIYTVNAGLLDGKWYHAHADVGYDDAGYGLIRWFLRSHDNEDWRFVYQASRSETVVHFFKQNMVNSPENIQAFQDTYYFDPSGDFYVSADGVNYTAKNGEASTGVLADDAPDARLISAVVAGRTVAGFDSNPDERTGEIDLHIKLVFSTGTGLPEGWDDGSYVIQHGLPDERTRLVYNVVAATLPENLDLTGDYEDIPLAEYGTVVDLSGRRVVRRTTRDERLLDDLQFSYDLVELILTAPIAPADAWFSVGRAVQAEAQDNRLSTYRVQDLSYDYIRTITAPRWRAVTVERFRKFFVRQPTDADLTAATADADTDADYSAPEGGRGPDTVYTHGQFGQLHFVEKRVTTRGVWQVWDDDGEFRLTAYDPDPPAEEPEHRFNLVVTETADVDALPVVP